MTASIATADVTFVIQGPINATTHAALAASVEGLRKLAPGCQVVVSTWEADSPYAEVGADKIVLSSDPGSLRSIRPDGQFLNNVNRQIVSTRHGLEAADRPYAVKLRVDNTLSHLGFIKLYETYADEAGSPRMVTSAYFTVDPNMFEHVPYHISDWFHFGLTTTLRSYWSCPLMTPEDAVYYEAHAYAKHSTYIDKRFYCRFPTEQHIAIHYARLNGFTVPEFHNDVRADVMKDHQRFLAERLIVAEPNLIGLEFPKYEAIIHGGFQKLNCISFIDWLGIAGSAGKIPLSKEQRQMVAKRRRRKTRARLLFLSARPAWGFLATPFARRTVNRVLRFIFAR